MVQLLAGKQLLFARGIKLRTNMALCGLTFSVCLLFVRSPTWMYLHPWWKPNRVIFLASKMYLTSRSAENSFVPVVKSSVANRLIAWFSSNYHQFTKKCKIEILCSTAGTKIVQQRAMFPFSPVPCEKITIRWPSFTPITLWSIQYYVLLQPTDLSTPILSKSYWSFPKS